MYGHLETEARKIGLLVNEKKTKYMFVSAVGNTRELQNLQIGNKEFEGVSEFKHLGNNREQKLKLYMYKRKKTSRNLSILHKPSDT
jgi:hypothetical protein